MGYCPGRWEPEGTRVSGLSRFHKSSLKALRRFLEEGLRIFLYFLLTFKRVLGHDAGQICLDGMLWGSGFAFDSEYLISRLRGWKPQAQTQS